MLNFLECVVLSPSLYVLMQLFSSILMNSGFDNILQLFTSILENNC